MQKLNLLLESMMKSILHSDKNDPYSRQKMLKEFGEFYKPKQPEIKRTYHQNWSIYYQACRTEKLMFFRILKDVVDYLEIPQIYSYGRPCADLKDILKALCIKAYSGQSSWRVDSELKITCELGIIDNVYKKTSLNKYLNKPEVTYWLHKILQTIAQPLAVIENKIAIDSTGISVAYGRKRWVEVRDNFQLHKDYKKLHIISGTVTNAVLSAVVTDGRVNDAPYLEPLLNDIKGKFSPIEISGDAGYLSRKNVECIAKNGIVPYIMPKKNVKAYNKGYDFAWNRMINLWKNYEDLFRLHYHQRSNIESTFGMLKRRFSPYVRVKLEIGQINEILARIVCLNATILSEAMMEFNFEVEFMDT